MNDGLKTPFADSLSAAAAQRATDAIAALGRALPCEVVSRTGQIVTVKFNVQGPYTLPPVDMPIATSPSDWIPIGEGTLGVTMPADVYLGGVSGLGGGVATFAPVGNLTALVFVPVSNAGWSAPPDADQRVVQSPNGVLLRDVAGTASVNIQPGMVTLSAGGHEVVVSSAGVVIDGKVFSIHEHLGVTTGTGTSGPVAP